jgi:hypothetical protein
MATGSPPSLGALVPDGSEVFRALSNKNNLRNKTLRETTYFRRAKDTDGLSVGLTPTDAIRHVRAFGIAALPVAGVRALNRGLEVRTDSTEAGHALILNLPFVEQDRGLAEEIGWELVGISRIVSTDYSEPQQPSAPVSS